MSCTFLHGILEVIDGNVFQRGARIVSNFRPVVAPLVVVGFVFEVAVVVLAVSVSALVVVVVVIVFCLFNVYIQGSIAADFLTRFLTVLETMKNWKALQ